MSSHMPEVDQHQQEGLRLPSPNRATIAAATVAGAIATAGPIESARASGEPEGGQPAHATQTSEVRGGASFSDFVKSERKRDAETCKPEDPQTEKRPQNPSKEELREAGSNWTKSNGVKFTETGKKEAGILDGRSLADRIVTYRTAKNGKTERILKDLPLEKRLRIYGNKGRGGKRILADQTLGKRLRYFNSKKNSVSTKDCKILGEKTLKDIIVYR